MKRLLIILLVLTSFWAQAQNSSGLSTFEKLIDLKGTQYLLGYVVNTTTLGDINTMNLVYINTETGDSDWIDLPIGTIVIDFKQIKLDQFEINQVAILARIYDADNNGRINMKDPISLFMVSTDGKKETYLTKKNFFVRLWQVDEETGKLVVTGFYDKNKNGRFDNGELNEVQIFDLNTLELLYKF